MKKVIFLFIGLHFAAFSMAQMVNTGLPIGITTDTKISLGSFTSATPVFHDGQIIATGEVSIARLTGKGSISLAGGDQSVNLGDDAALDTLSVSGGGTKKLLSTVLIDDRLDFVGARISTTSGDLVLGENATITGFNSSNYVLGKLIRQGAGDLVYPVGVEGLYTPVELLDAVIGSTGGVGVELVNNGITGSAGNGLLSLSDQRFWRVTEERGPFEGSRIRLPLIDETFASAPEDAVIAASAFTGTYRSLGAASTTGDLANGTIESNSVFGPGLYAFGIFFDEQLRVNDSTALVKIYNETKGQSWHNKGGWLSGNIDDWTGITVSQKRVAQVDLSDNNLTGTIPLITTGLEKTTSMDLGNNFLRDIQGLVSLTGLQNLNVSGNRLQFGPLELLLVNDYEVFYQNQKDVLERKRVLREIDETYTVDRTVSGTQNSYSWFDGETAISQSGPTFDVTVSGFESEGDFLAEVTNPNVPGLTIRTTPVLLRVSSLERDSTSLVTLYDSLTGDNWIDNSGWKVGPIDQWVGVTLGTSGRRVTGLSLPSNNLSGNVPEDIVDIGSIGSIDLADNEIRDLPDMSEMSELFSLNVSGNEFDFGDLEPNIGVTGINYTNQATIAEELTVQIDKGEDYLIELNTPGTANRYQWKRNGTLLPASDNNSFLLQSIDFENMGTYTMEVKNDLVPDLTLVSEPQNIYAQADIAFTPIYQDIDREPAQLDEGEAWLFEIIPNKPWDTIGFLQIQNDGILFENIRLGNYSMFVRTDSLLIRLKDGRRDSIRLIPTYFESELSWEDADVLQLRDFIDDSLFMLQQPPPLTAADGDGQIGLVVESNFDEGESEGGRIEARRRVSKAGCSLRRRTRGSGGRTEQDDEFELIAYKETDENGEVSFGFLPTGSYRLNIQYPGVPMDTTSFIEFEISEDEEQDGYELAATVTEEGITVEVVEALGFYRKYFKDLNVFPNAANEVLSITYQKLMADDVHLKMTDLRGQTILEEALPKGYHQRLKLDVSDVEGGVYLLYFYDSSFKEKNITTFKVIVRH